MADFEHILLNILENKRAKNLENSAKCAYKPIFSYSIKSSILPKMSLTTFLHSADELDLGEITFWSIWSQVTPPGDHLQLIFVETDTIVFGRN